MRLTQTHTVTLVNGNWRNRMPDSGYVSAAACNQPEVDTELHSPDRVTTVFELMRSAAVERERVSGL